MSPSPDPFPPIPSAPPHPAGRPCAQLCTPDCTAGPADPAGTTTAPTVLGWPEDGC